MNYSRLRRWSFGLILALSLGLGSAHAAEPAFRPAACDLPGVTADLAPRLTCGTVAVPRDRSAPAVGVFRLAVVIVRPRLTAHADPVLYIAGGPGSPLTSRAALLAQHEADIVAPDRDLILVDQRGADRSEPPLCPDLAARQLAILAAGAVEPVLIQTWRDSFRDCRREMTQTGLQPEWFGTQISAADADTVRQALGLDRWNIYAISYGTSVAMTMVALYPNSLRAVVLDSVFPPDPLPLSLPQSFERARSLLFAACAADADCANDHPDLEASFQAAERTLDAAPLPVPLSATDPAVISLRAELFRLIVNRALYSRAGMAALPAFIDAARDRDTAALQPVIASVVRGYRALSLGELEAVECRDRPSWRDADAGAPVSAYVPGVCADWSPLGPPPLIPHATRVPTLVLSGRADPITPPAFAYGLAAQIGPAARVVAFANVGHGVQQASPCAERLVSDFIRDPILVADATCANAVGPVRFR